MSSFDDEIKKIEADLIGKVETKVEAASTAAGITGFLVMLLGLYVVHGAVPDWLTAAVGALVTTGLTFGAGWLAKHTPRPSDTPPAPAPPSA